MLQYNTQHTLGLRSKSDKGSHKSSCLPGLSETFASGSPQICAPPREWLGAWWGGRVSDPTPLDARTRNSLQRGCACITPCYYSHNMCAPCACMTGASIQNLAGQLRPRIHGVPCSEEVQRTHMHHTTWNHMQYMRQESGNSRMHLPALVCNLQQRATKG